MAEFNHVANPFHGEWTYRSLFNVTENGFMDLDDPTTPEEWESRCKQYMALFLGNGTIKITSPHGSNILVGTIGGPGWELQLHGSITYGNPNQIRFQGTGVIGGEEWVYDYEGYLTNHWANAESFTVKPDPATAGTGPQIPAIVGTIVRTKTHTHGTHLAGVTGSWIACKKSSC